MLELGWYHLCHNKLNSFVVAVVFVISCEATLDNTQNVPPSLAPDQEKILALLASWAFHRKPTAKRGNIYIEKVLYIAKKQTLKKFRWVEILLKQTFYPKMAKIAPKLNKVSLKMAKIIHIWSMWRQVRETWSKSYCQLKILLAARLLGFPTFSRSAVTGTMQWW